VFLLLIVGLPMIVIAVLATRTADDAASGKADARLFAGLETATELYEDDLAGAERAAKAIGTDPALSAALAAGDPGAVQSAAEQLAGENGVVRLELRAPDGANLASVGDGRPFAPAGLDLTDDAGKVAAGLTVAVTDAESYVQDVEDLTGRLVAVYSEGDRSVAISGGENVEIPADGGENVPVGEREQRVLTADLPDDGDLRVAMFGPVGSGGILANSPAVVAILAGVFLIALAFVITIQRTLSGQVEAMLEAAKRIGGGDFSQKVPVTGGPRDEMAGLATEFNKMSDRLSAQMEQLRAQQHEIDRSVRRIGEAFAAGLDRDSLLEIITETAVSACGAEYGRISLPGSESAGISSGAPGAAVTEVAAAAESRAGRADEPTELREVDCHAMAAPLHPIGEPERGLGVMTIARSGEPFTDAQRDVFRYLIGQASASIENVALHEMVSEQAVTDELTGLANNRAFRDVATREAARARRFGHPLSLLMLDVDDFKQVNDTHGHPQGDEVLKRIGAILRDESRGIDLPARYGGEEFAVALPETDPVGAAEVAERIRGRVESEPVGFVDGDGALQVTASLGVASIPESASDVRGLVAAADAALYAAKRGGKNRVEQAPAGGRPQEARVRGR
jgi:diguanylate cyclase (GGDEF)-like protein